MGICSELSLVCFRERLRAFPPFCEEWVHAMIDLNHKQRVKVFANLEKGLWATDTRWNFAWGTGWNLDRKRKGVWVFENRRFDIVYIVLVSEMCL